MKLDSATDNMTEAQIAECELDPKAITKKAVENLLSDSWYF